MNCTVIWSGTIHDKAEVIRCECKLERHAKHHGHMTPPSGNVVWYDHAAGLFWAEDVLIAIGKVEDKADIWSM